MTDLEPTTVPLMIDNRATPDTANNRMLTLNNVQTNQQRAEGPRLSLLTATMGGAASVMSVVIRVIKGAIYIYDLLTETWRHL